MAIDVQIFESEEELDRKAAEWLAARVRPGAVFGLATGNTSDRHVPRARGDAPARRDQLRRCARHQP